MLQFCRLLRWHHPSISHFSVGQQLHTSRQYSCQVSLLRWESPSIPPPTNLLPLTVKMPRAMGDRVLKDKMITANLPVSPEEHKRGPLSGRPVRRHLARWVSTPLGHLTMSPPASTSKSTPPQCGGGARVFPSDPLRKAAKYKSAGWRKDLEHVIKIYYKHNVASFKEVECVKIKKKFFTHLLQHKEEWRDIKENHPMEYMPYIEDHFYAAMGLRLNGLRDFTEWIKPGSFYHGLVARQGHLYKCPHLGYAQ